MISAGFDVLPFSDLGLLIWHFGFGCVGGLCFGLWFGGLWFGFWRLFMLVLR